MGLTFQEVLVRSLKKLEKTNFEKFIKKLSAWKVTEQYKNIPQDLLSEKDPEHVAGLINEYYKLSYGSEVTLAVLEDIGEKEVWEELQDDLREVDSSNDGLGTEIVTVVSPFVQEKEDEKEERDVLVGKHLSTIGDKVNVLSKYKCENIKRNPATVRIRDSFFIHPLQASGHKINAIAVPKKR